MFPQSLHGPVGRNDNNLKNKYPPQSENTGNYNGRFNPNTPQPFSNFNDSYNQPQPIIEKINYANKNNVLHNNIADNVLDEHITEYRVYVDSTDRDIKVYPSPYHFTVKFNSCGTSTVQHEKPVDPKNKNKGTKIVTTKFNGGPSPLINKDFRNVKFIRLENVILPQCYKILDHKTFDPDCNHTNERYVTVAIKELNNERSYSTSDNVTRIDSNNKCYTPPIPFAYILPDKYLGVNYYSGATYYGNKIYKNSLLGNITQLTIDFYDSVGLPIYNDNMFTYEDLQEYEKEHGHPLPITDLRHPLNKNTQVNLFFIIGVVESQINTLTKFEQ